MKMRVQVDGRSYDVEVEMLDGGAAASMPSGAMSRVEGAPLGSPPKPPASNGNGVGGRVSTNKSGAAGNTPIKAPLAASSPAASQRVESAPREPVAPLPPREPWHGIGVGNAGEAVAPVPGVVSAVHVKVGDDVHASEAIASIQVSQLYSPGAKPLIGTVRALASGVVLDVLVREGDAVGVGQVMARIGERGTAVK